MQCSDRCGAARPFRHSWNVTASLNRTRSGTCSNRSISPGRPGHMAHAGTDRWTDTILCCRLCLAYYAVSANNYEWRMSVTCIINVTRESVRSCWTNLAGSIDFDFHVSIGKDQVQSTWHKTLTVSLARAVFDSFLFAQFTAGEVWRPW